MRRGKRLVRRSIRLCDLAEEFRRHLEPFRSRASREDRREAARPHQRFRQHRTRRRAALQASGGIRQAHGPMAQPDHAAARGQPPTGQPAGLAQELCPGCPVVALRERSAGCRTPPTSAPEACSLRPSRERPARRGRSLVLPCDCDAGRGPQPACCRHRHRAGSPCQAPTLRGQGVRGVSACPSSTGRGPATSSALMISSWTVTCRVGKPAPASRQRARRTARAARASARGRRPR
jgi:hypothetical protein